MDNTSSWCLPKRAIFTTGVRRNQIKKFLSLCEFDVSVLYFIFIIFYIIYLFIFFQRRLEMPKSLKSTRNLRNIFKTINFNCQGIDDDFHHGHNHIIVFLLWVFVGSLVYFSHYIWYHCLSLSYIFHRNASQFDVEFTRLVFICSSWIKIL